MLAVSLLSHKQNEHWSIWGPFLASTFQKTKSPKPALIKVPALVARTRTSIPHLPAIPVIMASSSTVIGGWIKLVSLRGALCLASFPVLYPPIPTSVLAINAAHRGSNHLDHALLHDNARPLRCRCRSWFFQGRHALQISVYIPPTLRLLKDTVLFKDSTLALNWWC